MEKNQRKTDNKVDKLWTSIENEKRVLQERNVNNCILVSCDDVQIGNVGHKRTYRNEGPPTMPAKKLMVEKNGSFDYEENEDEEMAPSKNPIVEKLRAIGGIATTGYNVDLSKIAIVLCENPICIVLSTACKSASQCLSIRFSRKRRFQRRPQNTNENAIKASP
ncbi:2633_t:CDS:2 [Diversispora eburnea]|uniref:2633_t:CDS:1 n=1 Tax=Diversispora eburnea TaxID=1213867 RepID=A0A9N8WC92_9GLOM|nr:2633_t:CDS:2 [Diversispora eburnea]